MIEIFIIVVAFLVFGVAICVILCAFCHCLPVLCLALGIGASRWRNRRRSGVPGASYSPIQGQPQGNSNLVTADAYILPPLEVQDVYVVTETDSSTATMTTESQKHHESNQVSAPVIGPDSVAHQFSRIESGDMHGDDDSSHHITYRGLLDIGMFKDTLAAVAFLINCCVLVMLAGRAVRLLGSAGDTSMQSSGPNDSGYSSDSSGDAADDFGESMIGALGAYFLVALFATVLTCSVYLTLLMKYASRMITATIWGSIAFFAAVGVISLVYGGLIPAIFAFIAAALSYWWLTTAQSRIEFASVILKTAVSAVKDNFCSLISASLFLQALQVMYMLAWSLALGYWVYASHNLNVDGGDGEPTFSGRRLAGALHAMLLRGSSHHDSGNPGYKGAHDHGGEYSVSSHSSSVNDWHDNNSNNRDGDGDGDGNGFTLFLFLLSLYWGIQVFRNVVCNTVAGTMACWWFTPARTAIVAGALFRAFTTSFGTICFGSLVVSIVQTLRVTLEGARDRAHRSRSDRGSSIALECSLWLFSFLLRMLEATLSFVNKYALVYSAAYGTNFATSGARVWELFKKRGWTQIISDNLIGNTLGLGVFATACMTSVFAYLTSFLFDQDLRDGGVEKPRFGLVAGGFVLGLTIGLLVMTMIESAVASVFVFFAEDPKELQRTHPGVHDELCIAWMAMHPTSLNVDSSSGGHRVVAPNAVHIETVMGAEPYDPSDSSIALSPSLERQGVRLHPGTPSAPMVPAQLPL